MNSCNSSFDNILVAIFGPSLGDGFGGPDLVENNVGQTGYDEAGEEIETVDICCSNGNGLTDGAGESNDVNDNSKDISNLSIRERYRTELHMLWD